MTQCHLVDPAQNLRDLADKLRQIRDDEKRVVPLRDQAIYDALDYGIRTAVVREITGLSAQQISRILQAERKRRGIPKPDTPAE